MQSSMQKTENFKEAMEEIHQPVPESEIFEDLEPAVAFADKIGYPVIIRPAYTLGGTGGGIAHDRYEMEEIANRGIKLSPINQILVERSIAGWKEVEFEVMRDGADNCIIVCAMENIDPVGVHTGDSIVVAPTQTLTDQQYQMLRTASLISSAISASKAAATYSTALIPRRTSTTSSKSIRVSAVHRLWHRKQPAIRLPK